MAELADALDLGSSAPGRMSSSLVARTTREVFWELAPGNAQAAAVHAPASIGAGHGLVFVMRV